MKKFPWFLLFTPSLWAALPPVLTPDSVKAGAGISVSPSTYSVIITNTGGSSGVTEGYVDSFLVRRGVFLDGIWHDYSSGHDTIGLNSISVTGEHNSGNDTIAGTTTSSVFTANGLITSNAGITSPGLITSTVSHGNENFRTRAGTDPYWQIGANSGNIGDNSFSMYSESWGGGHGGNAVLQLDSTGKTTAFGAVSLPGIATSSNGCVNIAATTGALSVAGCPDSSYLKLKALQLFLGNSSKPHGTIYWDSASGIWHDSLWYDPGFGGLDFTAPIQFDSIVVFNKPLGSNLDVGGYHILNVGKYSADGGDAQFGGNINVNVDNAEGYVANINAPNGQGIAVVPLSGDGQAGFAMIGGGGGVPGFAPASTGGAVRYAYGVNNANSPASIEDTIANSGTAHILTYDNDQENTIYDYEQSTGAETHTLNGDVIFQDYTAGVPWIAYQSSSEHSGTTAATMEANVVQIGAGNWVNSAAITIGENGDGASTATFKGNNIIDADAALTHSNAATGSKAPLCIDAAGLEYAGNNTGVGAPCP